MGLSQIPTLRCNRVSGFPHREGSKQSVALNPKPETTWLLLLTVALRSLSHGSKKWDDHTPPSIQVLPTMDHQMEKKTGNQMETEVMKGLYRDSSIQMIPIGHENLHILPALGCLDPHGQVPCVSERRVCNLRSSTLPEPMHASSRNHPGQARTSPRPSPLVPYWNTWLLSDSGIPQRKF